MYSFTGRALVPELAELFQVSESTVRRDLRDLEEAKQLRRTHGGAVAIQQDSAEPSFVEKEDRYRTQKEDVAQKALSFIEEGDTIFLDSGTTTYYMSKHLKYFQQLTVVTNSNMVAEELKQVKHINLLLTGGTLRHETQAMVGPVADRTIGSIRVDQAVLSHKWNGPGWWTNYTESGRSRNETVHDAFGQTNHPSN